MPAAGASSIAPVGLPITRNYTLDEIGDVSRNVRLGFDPAGRLAVISGDACVVLNDATWLDIAERGADLLNMLQLVTDAEGNAFVGALAAWGIAELTGAGRLRPVSFRPDNFPALVGTTNFTHIIPLESGVYFGGLNGVVHWNRATREQTFFNIPSIASI